MKCVVVFLGLLLPLSLSAQRPITDFLQVAVEDNEIHLQPAATTYEKDGIAITLIGAVHLADHTYFQELNRRFQKFDALLYEMIGGEKMGEIQKKLRAGEVRDVSEVAKTYATIARFLKLATQKDEIEYGAKNFVHADLTAEEYQALREKGGEGLIEFVMGAADQTGLQDQATVEAITAALESGDAEKAKRLLMPTVAGGDESFGGLMGPSLIITDRNEKCLHVLDGEITKGHRQIGIFYGAAHLPGLERELRKRGYKKTRHEWINAWSVKNISDNTKEKKR